MKCPVCNSLMIVVEHEKIELDYCLNCSGVWFDAEELELLLETMELEGTSLSLDNILTSPDAQSSEKKRKCPICNQKMKKTTIGQQIIIDICRQGHGLWFDNGEVNHLIRLLAEKLPEKPGSQQQIIRFLGEVFKAKE